MSLTLAAPPIDADELRLRHEFLALPGLTLTLSQTARLLDLRPQQAERLLLSLEAEGLLRHMPGGAYCRADRPMA
jgi:hypothetical protein